MAPCLADFEFLAATLSFAGVRVMLVVGMTANVAPSFTSGASGHVHKQRMRLCQLAPSTVRYLVQSKLQGYSLLQNHRMAKNTEVRSKSRLKRVIV